MITFLFCLNGGGVCGEFIGTQGFLPKYSLEIVINRDDATLL